MTSAEDIALRPFSAGFDWGRRFLLARRRGFDHGWCAHVADEAQRRYARKRGHRARGKS